MDESYKSGVFRVTFEVEVIVKDGHHGEAIASAYQRLKGLMEGSGKVSRTPGLGGHFDVKSDNLRDDWAWFNNAEVKQIWEEWGPPSEEPKPGDTVRLWLEDASVRGTLYEDVEDDDRLRVALLPPGVDPLNTTIKFASYLVSVNGRDRRMELVERQPS